MNLVLDFIRSATGAEDVQLGDVLQSLWSGYGHITRVHLSSTDVNTAILKSIEPPADEKHPRGWNTAASHQRKLQSYRVEIQWYQQFAHRCTDACKVPALLGVREQGDSSWILLEDLDRGFPGRYSRLSVDECQVCLRWLANFHALFMNEQGQGLWPVGTYWHLATRQDEFEAMAESPLKQSAQALDMALNSCRYKTLLHGDAKLANFCFSSDKASVAAVDFQYTGRGCGIKDIVYFLGSCLDEHDCETFEGELLNRYFTELAEALRLQETLIDIAAVEQEWRSLYAIAWTDFYRFLAGWMPDHHKINQYTRRLAAIALETESVKNSIM